MRLEVVVGLLFAAAAALALGLMARAADKVYRNGNDDEE